MRRITLLLVLVLAVAACGGDDTATEPEAAEQPAAVEQAPDEAVEQPEEAVEQEAEEPAEESAEEEVAEEPAEEEAAQEPTEAEEAAEEDGTGVTLANFNKLENGMTYEEVVAILGSEGEIMSESEVAGIKTVMYQWEGEGGFGANMNAMFQNGEMMSKAQFGLE